MVRALALALTACCALVRPAAAETITIVCNASVQFAPVFYARDSGLFARHGLDVAVVIIGLNSNIPPLLVSGSAQIGGTTSSVLLQAVDSGLDLVAVAGAGISDNHTRDSAVLVRPAAGIGTPASLMGRTVGVPGVGAIFDVLFRNWLIGQKLDPTRIHFVETDLAQQMELLRSGSVDAVIGNNPSMQRIISSGAGTILGYFTDSLPGPIPLIVYAASAEWARSHPTELAAFRAVNAEAIAQVVAHPDDGRAAMGKFLKMPAEVLKDVTMPPFEAQVAPAQLQLVIDIMQSQDMLHGKMDARNLVFP